MAWDKEKDRKLARRAHMGRLVYDSAKGPMTKPPLTPKADVPAIMSRTIKVKVKV